MKRLLQLAFVLMACGMFASAAVVCTAGQNQLLSFYAANGGCTLGDKLFDGFAYTAGGSGINDVNVNFQVINPTTYSVRFTPVANGGQTTWNPGFNLSYNVSVQAPFAAQGYRIALLNDQSFYPVGATGDVTTFCLTSPALGCKTAINGADTVTFPTSGTIGATTVTNPASYTTQGSLSFGAGASTLGSIEASVTQVVPEPATFLLLGGGLVGFALYRRKKA